MIRRVTTLFALLLLASTAMAQNGARLLEYNARSAGRAGLGIGIFDSPELMVTNPAGLSFLGESALDVNVSLMFPSTHFKNDLNDKDGESNTFWLPSLSYAHRPESGPLAWGVGFFTTGGMGADFTLDHALFENPQTYHSMLAVMQGGPSIAWEFLPGMSVGASAHIVYSMLEFQMPFSLPPSIMKGVVNPMNGMTFGDMFAAPPPNGFGYSEVTAAANMDELAALGYQGRFGFAFNLGEDLHLGLSYAMQSDLTYKNGTATMDMGAQFMDAYGKAVQGYMMQNPGATEQEAQEAVGQQFAQMGIDPSLGFDAAYDVETTLALPMQMGLGLSYDASEDFRIGLDVEYVFWSKAFDKMGINLSNGSNANVNRMMGGNSITMDFPMEWEDTFIAKLGLEYDASSMLTLRGGYAYGANPVPQTTIIPVLPAIVEHHVSLGASVALPSTPLVLHGAFEYGLNGSLEGSTPHKVASEFAGSTSELSTMLLHFALTWTF